MHIIKVGNAYVTATGGLSVRQADALKVDIPPAGHTGTVALPRLVRFKVRGNGTNPVPPSSNVPPSYDATPDDWTSNRY
jgi:hypothetical protein